MFFHSIICNWVLFLFRCVIAVFFSFSLSLFRCIFFSFPCFFFSLLIDSINHLCCGVVLTFPSIVRSSRCKQQEKKRIGQFLVNVKVSFFCMSKNHVYRPNLRHVLTIFHVDRNLNGFLQHWTNYWCPQSHSMGHLIDRRYKLVKIFHEIAGILSDIRNFWEFFSLHV